MFLRTLLTKGKIVEVRISPGEVTSKDFELLRRFIDIQEECLTDEVECDEPKADASERGAAEGEG